MDYCSRTKRRKVKKAIDSILSKLNTEKIHNLVYVNKSSSWLPTFNLPLPASELSENNESNVIDNNSYIHIYIHSP